jgi:sulfite exporter TauE/SafE
MVPIVAAAFLAGLAGAPHCAGMCGPLLAAQARGVPATIGWHAGKALTYATLGVLAFTAASLVPRIVSWAPALGVLSWLVLLWFSLRLAGARLPRVALGGERVLLRLVGAVPRGAGAWAPVALGALVGLLPCGLVYAALALALAAPSAPAAATAMAAFALGTLPATIAAAWGVRLLAWRSRSARLAMAAVVLVLGTAAIAHRATLASAVLEDPSVCHGD